MKYPGRESIPIYLSSLAAGVTAKYGEMIMDFVLGNGFCIPLMQLVASIESKGFHQTQYIAQFAGSNVCLSQWRPNFVVLISSLVLDLTAVFAVIRRTESLSDS